MKFLVLPHIRIQNANALSSPYTIGFPAITAWLGAVHALERNLGGKFPDLKFPSVGIVSHWTDLQTYRGPHDYIHSIIGTANPLDKNGERPSFVEEARIHLDVTLIVELDGIRRFSVQKRILSEVAKLIKGRMKIAGGDILPSSGEPVIEELEHPSELMHIAGPGYALLERRDLMRQAMAENADALDALINALALHHRCESSENKIRWESFRRYPGWIVPVAIGFMGISPLGKAVNARDPDVPHRFAESVITLGEFRMPHRVDRLEEMLWRYRYDAENSLYLCETKQ
ncbi:type I-F CRISPR-associated protein Csy2 [Hydrogenimonas sp. SS33]|uniref:type I-F CRISPR-associated protein Csy2 n=1 Tax=Hydrogenimonas leucolamina TaxID=2954236 RepID=UPI00336BF91F